MEQNCDNCKDGPASECDEVSCCLHPQQVIPCFWEPKEYDVERKDG